MSRPAGRLPVAPLSASVPRWKRPAAPSTGGGRGRPFIALAVVSCVWTGALTGCGTDTESDPGVVADPSLVPILVDLHLAEARAETTGEPSDSLRHAVLRRFSLDSTALAERVERATRVPEDASALFQAVTDRLQATAVQLPDSTGP